MIQLNTEIVLLYALLVQAVIDSILQICLFLTNFDVCGTKNKKQSSKVNLDNDVMACLYSLFLTFKDNNTVFIFIITIIKKTKNQVY